jgi:RHS repeat-associated protein
MTNSAICASAVCLSPSRSTGKERDTESGNDYFGARYYASSMGRFMSPDPSALDYADPTNPQSLNLYAYAANSSTPISASTTSAPDTTAR